MYKLEQEVIERLDAIRVEKPKDKGEVRLLLLKRKLINLKEKKDKLLASEYSAVELLKKVDYANIKPKLVFCHPDQRHLWLFYRNILSSAPWSARPGRALYLFCMDENSGGVLGILDIGSDLMVIGPRDRYIGWSRDRKFGGGLNHIANVGTCVSSHPFGILTGGKFQIMACMSDYVTDAWDKRYGEPIAAVSTTSLFGKSSVYNRLQAYRYLGDTMGLNIVQLSEDVYQLFLRFLQENHLVARSSARSGGYTCKYDALVAVCGYLKYSLDKVAAHKPRGVYFAELYPNSLKFLRGVDDSLDIQVYNMNDTADWWLDRWYDMRYPKMKAEVEDFDYSQYYVHNQIDYIERLISENGDNLVA